MMRSRLVPALLELARARGLDADAMGRRFGVPPPCRTLADWSLDLPPFEVDRVVKLADAIADALDAPWLGLDLAAWVPRGAYGVKEFAVRNAPTLGEAGERLVRYQRLSNDAVRYEAEADTTSCALYFTVPGQTDGVGAHLNVFLAATLLSFGRQLSERRIVPREVHLAHARPDVDHARWTEVMGPGSLTYGAGRTALIFERQIWDIAIPRADAALLPVLDEYATRLVPLEDPGSGWPARVRDHLRRQLSGGAPTLEDCAKALRTTPRSLQRWLDESGTSYRALLEDLREVEGRRLVAGTELPLDEISFLLGYAHRRAFDRAFTRWTGDAPGRYRARHRG